MVSKFSNTPLFPGPISEWNDLQVELAYYCQYYYNIYYEIEDHPSDDIINDDYLLEQWLQKREHDRYIAERKARLEAAKQKGASSFKDNERGSMVFEF